MQKEVKTVMSRSFDARNVKVVGSIPWEHAYTLKNKCSVLALIDWHSKK